MVAAAAVALESDMDGILARSTTILIVDEAHCLVVVVVVVVPAVLDSSCPIVWRLEICCVRRMERKSSIAVTILFVLLLCGSCMAYSANVRKLW